MPMRNRRSKPVVILVVGESPNDTGAIAELARAIRPALPPIKQLRRPVVLRREISRERNSSLGTNLEGLRGRPR